MIKEQLLKLRTKIIGTSENEFDEIDLNSKIDKFINWYFQNKVKSHPNYDTNVEYYFTKRKVISFKSNRKMHINSTFTILTDNKQIIPYEINNVKNMDEHQLHQVFDPIFENILKKG